MQLRRIQVSERLELQRRNEHGTWVSHEDDRPLGGSVFAPTWLAEAAGRQLQHSEHLLPFQPLSFRDFMLYEQHTIDASRGLVRRFHPVQRRLATAVERLTGRP